MALGNLGDLIDQIQNNGSKDALKEKDVDEVTSLPDASAIYHQAIRSARTYYEDRHVYPYTFQGGYYHRHKMYKEAFNAWACAGDVIRK